MNEDSQLRSPLQPHEAERVDQELEERQKKAEDSNLFWYISSPFLATAVALLWVSAYSPWFYVSFSCTSSSASAFPSPPTFSTEFHVDDFVFPSVLKNSQTCGDNANVYCPVRNISNSCEAGKMHVVFDLAVASAVMASVTLVLIALLSQCCLETFRPLRRLLFLLAVFSFLAAFGTSIGAIASFDENCGDSWCTPLKIHFEEQSSPLVTCTFQNEFGGRSLGCGRMYAYWLCIGGIVILCILFSVFSLNIGVVCKAARWKQREIAFPLVPLDANLLGPSASAAGDRNALVEMLKSQQQHVSSQQSRQQQQSVNPLAAVGGVDDGGDYDHRHHQHRHSSGERRHHHHDNLQKEPSMNTFVRETIEAKRRREAASASPSPPGMTRGGGGMLHDPDL